MKSLGGTLDIHFTLFTEVVAQVKQWSSEAVKQEEILLYDLPTNGMFLLFECTFLP
jgi:hypothetical protein